MKTVKLKVNTLPGYSDIVQIGVDERGVPTSPFWRRRLRDAEFDNCVELVKPAKKSKPKSFNEEERGE